MDRWPLQTLANSLGGRAADWVREDSSVPSFHSRPSLPPGYVWPDIGVAAEPLNPIILIRSSGAMGKTSAARALARELKAPLVDLGRTRVGEDTLTGLLARALGWAGAAEFTTALRAGDRSLVLDGLDEAQLLVGKESYLAFLENVLELVDPSGPPGQVVAFGRHDAIETAQLSVLLHELEATVVPLLPLSLDQTHRLIDETLDLDPQCVVHQQHREPWRRLRDAQIDDITRALLGRSPADDRSDWAEVDNFLGYPPVILAVAESLKVENPAAESSRLAATRQGEVRLGRGRLLKTIVERILGRERDKVSFRLREALELSEEQAGQIYWPDEQVARLVAATTGSALVATPPQSIPPETKAKYEDLIEPWVVDHPFLRDRSFANVVFRDYVRAFVATSPLAEIFGLRRTELIGACGPVGPFFAHFAHAMTTPDAEADAEDQFSYGVITEDLLDDLIKSNALGVDVTPHAAYVHRGHHAHLTLGEAQAKGPSFGFHIDEPVGLIALRSPLSHVFVDSAFAVVLESLEGRVDLGPSVVIVANDLEIVGSALVAFPGSELSMHLGAVLLAAEPASHDPELSVKAHGELGLIVSWPGPTYQWRAFAVPVPTADDIGIGPHARQRLFHALRRLLTGFRSGAEPWMYYERYDNMVVGTNPLLLATRKALQNVGVLSRAGDQYTLDLPRLAEYGVNYPALQQMNWQVCLEQLALDVLKDTSVVELLTAE